jgi:hypothetical protein
MTEVVKGFTVTREWIHAHKSYRGGWNAKSLAVLGLTWKVVNQGGWIDRLDGTRISQKSKDDFERLCEEHNRKLLRKANKPSTFTPYEPQAV